MNKWEQYLKRWDDLESMVGRMIGRKREAVRAVPRDRSKPREREVVLFLSDLHFGSLVDQEEVPSESFDYSQANRRMSRLLDELVDYKPHYHAESSCRILMGGDLIEGRIHGPSNEITPLAEQVYFAFQQMRNAVARALEAFPRVNVTCVTGNHDRFPDLTGRAVTRKWDSLATLVYLYVRDIFRNDARVTVDVPRTPWAEWQSPGGHLCVLTHGDTFVSAGTVGKSINVGSISSQIRRFNASRSKRAEVFALGHLHTPTLAQLDDGTRLIVNGSLIGSGPYAQSLGIVDSNPTQLLWESVPGHPVGDMRFVRCK